MDKIVYFWLDVFCPIAYFNRQSGNNSDYQDNRVYLVISTGLPYKKGDSNSGEQLKTYLRDKGTGFNYKLLTATEAQSIGMSQPQNEGEMSFLQLVPVPPSPQTVLNFGGTGNFNAKDGQLGYFFPSLTDKLAFIVDNNSFVTCEPGDIVPDFDLLFSMPPGLPPSEAEARQKQLSELYTWLISYLTEIEELRLSGSADYQGPVQQIRENWPEKKSPFWTDSEVTLRDRLLQDHANERTLLKSYLAFVQKNIPDTPANRKTLPDSFKYTKLQLEAIRDQSPTRLNTLLTPENHYLPLLFDSFRRTLNEGPDTEEDAIKREAECVRQLQQFYGMGERLLVPDPALQHGYLTTMRVCDDDDPDGKITVDGNAERHITNAYSLSGQVLSLLTFGSGNLNDQNELAKIDSLSLLINGVEQIDDELKKVVRAAVQNSKDNNRFNFKRELSLFTDFSKESIKAKEKVLYTPVNGYGIPETLGDQTIYQVPEFILDRLEARSRVSLLGKKLITNQPQRTFLQNSELITSIPAPRKTPEERTIVSRDYKPAVFLKVQARRTLLADKDQNRSIWKIYRKADLQTDSDETDSGFLLPDDQKAFKTTVFENNSLKEGLEVFLHKGNSRIKISPLSDFAIDDDELLELYAGLPDGDLGPLGLTGEGGDLNLLLFETEEKAEFSTYILSTCFNALLPKPNLVQPNRETSPFLVLSNVFDFKFNRSVNTFSSVFKAVLKGDGFKRAVDHDPTLLGDPVLDDHQNFTKFRLKLAGEGMNDIQINEKDALTPIGEEEPLSDDASPTLYYQITHRFAEEVTDNLEDQRFLFYGGPDKRYSFKATFEHQYGHRLTAENPAETVSFGVSNPVRNLGNLLGLAEKTPTSDKERKPDTYAIGYWLNETKDTAGNATGTIELQLNKAYFEFADPANKALNEADKTKFFRNVYEALLDFRNNQVTLTLECWSFENRNTIPLDKAAKTEEAGQWPSVVDAMRLTHQESLPPSTRLLETVALDTYRNFKNWVVTYFDPKTELIQETIPLTPDLLEKVAASHLVRLRLDIERLKPGLTTVKNLFPNPAAIPDLEIADLKFPDLDPDSLFGDPTLRDNAKQYLQAYLDVKTVGLFDRSTAYIYSEQALRNITDRANNRVELFGDTLRFVFFPEADAATKTNAKFYYVPYAFKPLQINPAIGDATTTLEFARYLIQLVANFAYPEKQTIPFQELIHSTWMDPQTNESFDTKTLLEFRNAARQLIKDIVANDMAQLVEVVHTGEFNEVQPILDLLNTDRRQVLTSLLTSNPTLFNTAKGFGFCVYSGEGITKGTPGSLSDLYSLQITKEIDDAAQAVPSTMVFPYEQTRPSFLSLLTGSAMNPTGTGPARFFLESLEDARYDNEFQISETKTKRTFVAERPTDGQQIDEVITAVQGRTVEDIIEKQNFFSFQNQASAARVLIQHYNPNWQKKSTQEKYYLLPSRRPPTIPVQVPFQSVAQNPATAPDAIKQAIGKPMNQFKRGKKDWTFVAKTLADRYQTDTVWFSGDNICAFAPLFTYDKTTKVLEPQPNTQADLLDHYVNYYYFILEGDEEGKLTNDVVEIHFDDDNSPKSIAPAISSLQDNKLKKQFDYFRKDPANRSAIGTLEEIAIPDLFSATGELVKCWKEVLRGVEENETNSPVAFQVRVTEQTDDRIDLTVSLNPPNFAFENAVIACNVQSSDEKSDKASNLFLLKIAVLTHVTYKHQCRIRVLRNRRDFNEDGKNDINPVFQMNSGFSLWTNYGIQHLEYNYVQSAESIQWPDPLKYLKTEISLDTFFADPVPKGLDHLIQNTLNKAFNARLLTMHPASLTLSKRHGNAFTSVYLIPTNSADLAKKVKAIKAGNSAYSDKLDDKIASEVTGLDLLDMQLSRMMLIDESAYIWFVAVTFYQSSTNAPILTVNWQLQWQEE